MAEAKHVLRTRQWARNTWVALALIALAFIAILVFTGRYQLRPVLSGSMRPGFPIGGLVVTHEVPVNTLKSRDVIVFNRPDRPDELIVHRVTSLKHLDGQLQITTQGDANPAPDPWTVAVRGPVVYRAVFTVPLLGYPAVWAHSPSGRREILTLLGILVLLAAASTWRKEWRSAAKARNGSTPAPDFQRQV